MSQKLTITVADAVIKEIDDNMTAKKMKNKSEYVEELIRKGLAFEAQEID